MSKSFRARLIQDVHFFDFAGRRQTCKAGTWVFVAQFRSRSVSHDAQGRPVAETVGDYIASHRSISFDVSREQFVLDC